MSKEMYIASSPHETKVAVLEDDQLVEVYFERDSDAEYAAASSGHDDHRHTHCADHADRPFRRDAVSKRHAGPEQRQRQAGHG